MKLSLAALAVVLVSVAAASPNECTPGQLEKVVTLLSIASKSHVRGCQAASSGFSMFLPAAKSPSDEQVRRMCASSECLALTTDVMHAGLADCTLKWNGTSINPHEMASGFLALCAEVNSSTGSGSVDAQIVGQEANEPNAEAVVRLGIIETYRPAKTRVEHHASSPLPCPSPYADTEDEDAHSVTPTATGLRPPTSAKPEILHPAPKLTYIKHEVARPTPVPTYGERMTVYPTPVPTYVKHDTLRPTPASTYAEHEKHYPAPKPKYVEHKTTLPTPAPTYVEHKVQPHLDPNVVPKPLHSLHETEEPQPGHHWFEREMGEARDYKQNGIEYEEESDYTAAIDEDDGALVGNSDYEADDSVDKDSGNAFLAEH